MLSQTSAFTVFTGNTPVNPPYDWNNPENAQSDDASYTYTALQNTAYSNKLIAITGGFTLPTFANIKGIEVNVKAYKNSYTAIDKAINLVYNGAILGSDISWYNPQPWTTVESTHIYGNSIDITLWGIASITSSIVNDASFGCSFSILHSGEAGGLNFYVNYINMIVYYTAETLSFTENMSLTDNTATSQTLSLREDTPKSNLVNVSKFQTAAFKSRQI